MNREECVVRNLEKNIIKGVEKMLYVEISPWVELLKEQAIC